jgi:hypothetical protein
VSSPEVHVGSGARQVGHSACVYVTVLLDLSSELALVVQPRPREVAPVLVELLPILLQQRP